MTDFLEESQRAAADILVSKATSERMIDTNDVGAEHAHAADRFAHKIVDILTVVVVRSQRLMGRPFGRNINVLPDGSPEICLVQPQICPITCATLAAYARMRFAGSVRLKDCHHHRKSMSQQLPTVSRPPSNLWRYFTFLPYDHLMIVSPVPLDVARQRFQAFIDAQPRPKPFDSLFVGFAGNIQRPYYRGTFHDDHVLLSGPHGYRTWEFTIDGRLSLKQSGTSLDLVIRLDGLYGCVVLALVLLCVPVVIGVLTSWWFGAVATGMVVTLISIMIGLIQDALENVRDRLIDLLSPVPQFKSVVYEPL